MNLYLCKVCLQEKGPEHFYFRAGVRNGADCRECRKPRNRRAAKKDYHSNREARLASQKRWRQRNREYNLLRLRRASLTRNYGITLEQYREKLESQQGRCGLCGQSPRGKRRLAVDHNHETGRVRKLLCDNCNRGLGFFQEDPALMLKAVEYLEAYK